MDHSRRRISVAKLRELRVEQGLTVRGLARQCGERGHPISWSQLSKIEREISVPLEPTALAIAVGLGVPVAELLQSPSAA